MGNYEFLNGFAVWYNKNSLKNLTNQKLPVMSSKTTLVRISYDF